MDCFGGDESASMSACIDLLRMHAAERRTPLLFKENKIHAFFRPFGRKFRLRLVNSIFYLFISIVVTIFYMQKNNALIRINILYVNIKYAVQMNVDSLF